MNQLLNEAVKSYLSRRGAKEQKLEETLARLRAYRQRDPEFREAIADFAEAEAMHEDPLEGEAVEGDLLEGQIVAVGPTQSRVRELLNA
jgi:hypothetical protein